MKPTISLGIPRLYVMIMVYAVLFTALNIFILFYGRNLFIYFNAIWGWAGILLLAMIGAMLIGMVISYRLVVFREFTPFERAMMEMSLEVRECKRMLAEVREHLGIVEPDEAGATPGRPAGDQAGDDGGG
jgi:hypothetical protein